MQEQMVWGALSLLRVVWCLVPQKGYLHPDEFFQSPEVMAGDILGLEINRPWEFLPVFPCRTVLIPLLTSGTAFWIVEILRRLGFETAVNCGYILLVLPRLFITVLSFVLDYTVYQVAPAWGSNPWKALVLLAMSHVMLVFYTRTISNAIEGMLFAVLLLLTSSGKCNITVTGMVLAAGFFNRPTFLCFAFMPVLYKVSQSDKSQFSYTAAMFNLIRMLPSVMFTSLIFMVADTMYYTGHYPVSINCTEGLFNQVIQNTILTPLNFLRYNLNPRNLAQHGVHPPITHLAVNGLMLFGALHVYALCSGINMIKHKIWLKSNVQKSENGQQSLQQNSLLLMFYFAPLLLMSLFKHQEPRFLIPLVLPLVLLVSNYNRTVKTKCVIVLFNVLGALFFGCLHQAGLIPSLFHIQQIVQSASSGNMSSHHTILFTHTYMPPYYLLGLQKGQTSVGIIDLAGMPEVHLCQKLQGLQADLSHRNSRELGTKRHHFIIVFPGTIRSLVETCGLVHNAETFFTPHLSMEDPPMISHLFTGNLISHIALHIIEVNVDT
ncbi:GPI mannosyltransferase 4 [Pseudophryne corroboree]|uniref:GPI mannosyltransferase 4 n=1 Tax=Pseudophryne corroboree TaxID=495146 RepID=UPI0030818725